MDNVNDLIERLSNSSDDHEKGTIIVKLWNTGDKQGVMPVINVLGDEPGEAVYRAIQYFRYVRDEAGVMPLTAMLEGDLHISIKAEIARTLATLGDARAIEPIKRLLKNMSEKEAAQLTDGGVSVKTEIECALEALGGTSKASSIDDLAGKDKDIALALKSWYRDRVQAFWKNNARREAICDDCNSFIAAGEGYLRPGNYLACEECTDALLINADWDKAKMNLNRYFGPDIPDSIKNIL